MSVTEIKKEKHLRNLISYCFLFSVISGFVGSFVTDEGIQHLLWALGAFFMIISASLLGSKLSRDQHDIPAAGFTVIAIGQAMSYGFIATHDAGTAQFGAVIAIYVPGLILISFYNLAPIFLRICAFVGAISFSALASLIFLDAVNDAFQQVFTQLGFMGMNIAILGWAWLVHRKKI